jgi:hypothetical protein
VAVYGDKREMLMLHLIVGLADRVHICKAQARFSPCQEFPMRIHRSASPAPPTLRFASRCIASIKTAPVIILRVLRRKPLQRKLVSFAMALNLLVWPGPALLACGLDLVRVHEKGSDLFQGISNGISDSEATTHYTPSLVRKNQKMLNLRNA